MLDFLYMDCNPFLGHKQRPQSLLYRVALPVAYPVGNGRHLAGIQWALKLGGDGPADLQLDLRFLSELAERRHRDFDTLFGQDVAGTRQTVLANVRNDPILRATDEHRRTTDATNFLLLSHATKPFKRNQ
jgi:hypothetical protein